MNMKLGLKLGFRARVLNIKVPRAGFGEDQGLYAKEEFPNGEIYWYCEEGSGERKNCRHLNEPARYSYCTVHGKQPPVARTTSCITSCAVSSSFFGLVN